jgi:hypothetical protein
MKKHIEQHISIPFRTLKSKEYLELPAPAKAILEQMLMYYYPNQPDRHISMSYREVHEMFGYSFGLISRSFKKLLEKKFIFLEYHGGLNTPSKYSINDKFFKLKYV